MFWKEFEKIKSFIGPELKRLSKTIEMLKLSEEVHEKIIRQIFPEATEEQVSFVVCNYSQINPFYYPHWRDCFREENTEGIDEVYETVAKMAISNPNALEIVVAAEIDMIGRDEDEDLLDYYIIKYVRTHMHAIKMWKEKIASERKEFEKTLKAWVGLFVPDESVSEHYYQVISETLSPYSVR